MPRDDLYPLISAVLVSWNRRPLIQQAIQSLYQQNYPHLEVIVIDNASTDDSLSWLQSQSDVITIFNTTNRGASVARNQGTRMARGKYILYMDSDAEMRTPYGLHRLVEALEKNPKIGGISGVIYSDERCDTIWSWSTRMDWEANHDLEASLVPQSEIQALSTCFVLFRATLIKEVGGFDEYFFYLYEDADLCDRILKKGYELKVLPQVKIVHHYARPGRTTQGNIEYHYYHEKLRMYFLLKNWGIRRFLLSWWFKIRSPRQFLKRFDYLPVLCYIDIYYIRVFFLIVRYPWIRRKRQGTWLD